MKSLKRKTNFIPTLFAVALLLSAFLVLQNGKKPMLQADLPTKFSCQREWSVKTWNKRICKLFMAQPAGPGPWSFQEISLKNFPSDVGHYLKRLWPGLGRRKSISPFLPFWVPPEQQVKYTSWSWQSGACYTRRALFWARFFEVVWAVEPSVVASCNFLRSAIPDHLSVSLQ